MSCTACEARKARLREQRGLVGRLARRVFPEVKRSGEVKRVVWPSGAR